MLNSKTKIVFMCRDSLAAKFVVSKLAEKREILAVLIEDGKFARKKKVVSLFKKTAWIMWPFVCLDFLALWIHGHLLNSFLRRNLSPDSYPSGIAIYRVHDINSEESQKILKDLLPNIAVVYGTSILKKEILSMPFGAILNIHGGIVPFYRNVQSEFWALYNKDYSRIGTTIMHIDSGIDTGNIAIQEVLPASNVDSLRLIKKKNIELAARLLIQSLSLYEKNQLPNIPQNKAGNSFLGTPHFNHIVTLFLRGKF